VYADLSLCGCFAPKVDLIHDVKLSAWRLLHHCRDAEEEEAAACHEGVAMAARWPDIPMVLETKCAVVAGRLKSKEHDYSMT